MDRPLARRKRIQRSGGAPLQHECWECGERFATEHGLAVHAGKEHKYEVEPDNEQAERRAPTCGRSRYMTDIEHRATGCPDCKAACARYNAEWRARNRQRDIPSRVHGTPGGYTNWGCRLGCCTTAYAQARGRAA